MTHGTAHITGEFEPGQQPELGTVDRLMNLLRESDAVRRVGVPIAAALALGGLTACGKSSQETPGGVPAAETVQGSTSPTASPTPSPSPSALPEVTASPTDGAGDALVERYRAKKTKEYNVLDPTDRLMVNWSLFSDMNNSGAYTDLLSIKMGNAGENNGEYDMLWAYNPAGVDPEGNPNEATAEDTGNKILRTGILFPLAVASAAAENTAVHADAPSSERALDKQLALETLAGMFYVVGADGKADDSKLYNTTVKRLKSLDWVATRPEDLAKFTVLDYQRDTTAVTIDGEEVETKWIVTDNGNGVTAKFTMALTPFTDKDNVPHMAWTVLDGKSGTFSFK